MRLIDADELIKHIWKLHKETEERYDLQVDELKDVYWGVVSLIDDQPTVTLELKGALIGTVLKDAVKVIDKTLPLMLKNKWIPVTKKLPEKDKYVLLSFENFSGLDIGRYDEDEEGGAFFPGDDEKSYSEYDLFVNAWMELPKPYRER